jgi:DnaJ-class molecular chaperone
LSGKHGIDEDVLKEIMLTLEPQIEKLQLEKFIEEHKYEIIIELTYANHNICPSCKGKGGRWESCYHNDVEWIECCMCKGSGEYVKGKYDKYFQYIM